MTTLISFLGKGRDKDKVSYRQATYRFPDGSVRTTTYFGLALADCLKPGRLVLMGTAGSMWDVFFESDADSEDEWIGLSEAVAESRVDAGALAGFGERLGRKLGFPVCCVLIPYAAAEAEQADVLACLAGCVDEGEQFALDITHSFRHLPMLALVAARYLTRVKRAHLAEIYYGALEMTRPGEETQVLTLSGLLQMLDWTDALASYDKDGDYGVFAPLLKQGGLPANQARQLEQAAFFERTSNPARARQTLTGVFKHLDAGAGPLGRLFQDELRRRLEWYRRPRRDQQELALADGYLVRRDYVRAAIFLQEAWISREVEARGGSPHDFDGRQQISEDGRQDRNYRQLSRLRNALAHGVKARDEKVLKCLQDENTLRAELERLRGALFAAG